jgi:hypothetical protein
LTIDMIWHRLELKALARQPNIVRAWGLQAR